LIVLHGMLGSSRNWQSAGADLAGRYHVHALDLRNHGRSPHDPVMTHDAMMGDVLAFMDSKGLARAAVMGHSMGGKVAMLLACRHPARVERLIVVDIAPKEYQSAAHRAEFTAMNELDLRVLQSRAEAEMKFEARVPDWGMRKFLTTNLERDENGGEWRWAINLPVITASLAVLEKNPLAMDERFAGPVLVVTGEKSNYVQPGDWPAVKKYFPQFIHTVIAASGHNPHMEAREAFVRAVLGMESA
jgi:esterase